MSGLRTSSHTCINTFVSCCFFSPNLSEFEEIKINLEIILYNQIIIIIFVYTKSKIMTQITCNRCSGTGKTVFHHVADGICFACNGTGKINYTPDMNLSLDNFYKTGKATIADGVACKMIKSCTQVGKGGEFIAKCDNDLVTIWNKRAGANWRFEVPKSCDAVLKEYFTRI